MPLILLFFVLQIIDYANIIMSEFQNSCTSLSNSQRHVFSLLPHLNWRILLNSGALFFIQNFCCCYDVLVCTAIFISIFRSLCVFDFPSLILANETIECVWIFLAADQQMLSAVSLILSSSRWLIRLWSGFYPNSATYY